MESKIDLWYLADGNLGDDYRTVLKDLKKIVEADKTLGLKLKPTKCESFFLVTSLKNDDRPFSNLVILGSPLGPKSQADLSEKKIIELEIVNGIVEKLDAHYGFFMLKSCFSLPKLYLLRTSTCFNHPALLEKLTKPVRDRLSQ